MYYVDLLDASKLERIEREFLQDSNEQFYIKNRDPFVRFYPKNWKGKGRGRIAYHDWKALLSVHPQDLHRAWEIIFPVLHQNNIGFKVIKQNTDLVQSKIEDKQEKLTQITRYCELVKNSALTSTSLKDFYKYVALKYQREFFSRWRVLSFFQDRTYRMMNWIVSNILNHERLRIAVHQKYEQLIQHYQQQGNWICRMHNGMQFSIYMERNSEQETQRVLEQIEKCLIDANSRPGTIYPTDRQIGVFSSIRHPGKWSYHPANTVETYNDDDSFGFLSTLPASEKL